jgi:hypothetical protein
MENVHNINLQPLATVIKWDTKRIVAYKTRIQKHISYLENRGVHLQGTYANVEESRKQEDIALQKIKNYKEELKKILAKREHID